LTIIILKDGSKIQTKIPIATIENHLRNQGWFYIDDIESRIIIANTNFDIIYETD